MNAGVVAVIVAVVVLVLLVLLSLRTVQQGTVAVTTVFGKYRRTLRPGLNVVIPFFEKIYRRGHSLRR